MKITEVRIKLMERTEDRLRGFCSITFDNAFVVRDLKIIEGNHGPFVAMPSRKLTSHCHKCRSKNHLKSNYCNNCGSRQQSENLTRDNDGRARLYADIAHPVNAKCREMIQTRIISEFNEEVERSKDPDYSSRYHDEYDAGPEHDHNLLRETDAKVEKSPDDKDPSDKAPFDKATRQDPPESAKPSPHENKDASAAEMSTPENKRENTPRDSGQHKSDGGSFGEGILD